MLFRQLYDAESSTYTYLLGDSISGEAVLIDPVLEQVSAQIMQRQRKTSPKAVFVFLSAASQGRREPVPVATVKRPEAVTQSVQHKRCSRLVFLLFLDNLLGGKCQAQKTHYAACHRLTGTCSWLMSLSCT